MGVYCKYVQERLIARREESKASVAAGHWRWLSQKQKRDRQKKYCTLLFQIIIFLLNVPIFGLLLTFAHLLTSVGMSSPMCLTVHEASYFNTLLWWSAMVDRAFSVLTFFCVPLFLQLDISCILLVIMSLIMTTADRDSLVALWFGTAGVGLFATLGMPRFIAWICDYLQITPRFMNLALCASGFAR